MKFSAVSASQLKRYSVIYIFCPLLLLFALSVMAFCPQTLQAAQATLAWDPSTSSGVTGYKLYWGTESRKYVLLDDVGNATSETVSDLVAGTTYYFAATAYDAAGNESDYSNEVAYTPSSGTTCTYSISPTSKSFTQSGGTGSVTVTTQSTCPWTASSSSSWMTITSGGSGTGNGTVSYSVSANTGTSSRTAASTIGGRTFTVTQSGGSVYTLSISKSGTGSGTVTNTPSGTSFAAGTAVTLRATPATNSTFTGWSGSCSGTATTCTVTMSSNRSVGAAFALKTSTTSYKITAGAGTGGTISPSGSVSVTAGTSRYFRMTPSSGYRVYYLRVDGRTIYTTATSFTFSNVRANHTIYVYFRRI